MTDHKEARRGFVQGCQCQSSRDLPVIGPARVRGRAQRDASRNSQSSPSSREHCSAADGDFSDIWEEIKPLAAEIIFKAQTCRIRAGKQTGRRIKKN
ncbi:unnamed protein product [Knipowitschia caucasica]|uniref:Uncharacterized protein n=1 Tax=Knipowitschia caucasica TaxID=637954 RepID=A0AAV2K4L8_KNICA